MLGPRGSKCPGQNLIGGPGDKEESIGDLQLSVGWLGGLSGGSRYECFLRVVRSWWRLELGQ